MVAQDRPRVRNVYVAVGEKGPESAKIGVVGGDRRAGEPALDEQIIEKALDPRRRLFDPRLRFLRNKHS